MPRDSLRIIDANLNRAREGLRVLEEYARLVLGDATLCERGKQARHKLSALASAFGSKAVLEARDIQGDVGTNVTTDAETARTDAADVARAAAKRVAESLRCVEEYGKIINPAAAAEVEQLRYRAYALEQDVFIGGPLRARLRRARLHVLITESLCNGPWLKVCEQALEGGADVLQLREKTLSDLALLARAESLRELTRRFDALLVINDRPDVARAAQADGVHLGREDLPVRAAREIVGPNLLIGKSTHSVAEARAALSEGADYLGVGPMVISGTKPDLAPRGPELLRSISSAVATHDAARTPLVAIGGITVENVTALGSAVGGAASFQVAVSRGVIGQSDVSSTVRRLQAALGATESRASSPERSPDPRTEPG